MIKLAILADDFTGALDTAVQFSSRGISTLLLKKELLSGEIALDCQVIAVDMQTRHLSRDKAYERVYSVCGLIRARKIPYLYIKTDSGLRGNIGATLEAAVRSWGESVVFAPAYPDTGRIVQQGILTIGGIPASRSHFAKDLFNPVLHDRVCDIIAEQSQIPVAGEEGGDKDAHAVVLRDAADNGKLEQIAREAVHSGCTLLAGCAGLARYLPNALNLKTCEVKLPQINWPMVVISGSTSPVSLEQLRHGREQGFRSYIFRDVLEKESDFFSIVQAVRHMTNEMGLMIELGQEIGVADGGGDFEEKGKRISDNLGKAAERIVRSGFSGTLFVFGGDTLASVVRQLGVTSIQPLHEIECGVVISRIDVDGRKLSLISKSGSFGSTRVLEDICEKYMRKGRGL